MIAVRNLKKRFERNVVLDGLSFEAAQGRITLLTGANGTGKSTVLRIMAGTLDEDCGEVIRDGDTLTAGERRRQCAVLPQGVAFQPRLHPRTLMRFYARVLEVDRDRMEPLLNQWGLIPHAHTPSGKLSGGLRQRLGLAVLEIRDSPVLLLDEPGLSLDPQWRRQMQIWLRKKAREGSTVVVATHLLAEWEDQADRCLVFADGQIADELDPSTLSGPNRLNRADPESG